MKSDGHRPQRQLTVGLNSSLKLIRSGNAQTVYLANDCAGHIRQAVMEAAAGSDAVIDESKTMAQLGAACDIDVGCAVCVSRKQ